MVLYQAITFIKCESQHIVAESTIVLTISGKSMQYLNRSQCEVFWRPRECWDSQCSLSLAGRSMVPGGSVLVNCYSFQGPNEDDCAGIR